MKRKIAGEHTEPRGFENQVPGLVALRLEIYDRADPAERALLDLADHVGLRSLDIMGIDGLLQLQRVLPAATVATCLNRLEELETRSGQSIALILGASSAAYWAIEVCARVARNERSQLI